MKKSKTLKCVLLLIVFLEVVKALSVLDPAPVVRPLSNSENTNMTRIFHKFGYKQYIDVYFESQCPDSRRFITTQLPYILDDFKNKVQVKLVPYGKASSIWDNVGNKWIYQCQHGPNECFGNMIQNCAIALYPDFDRHFPFVKCTMSLNGPFHDVVAECSRLHNLPAEQILACANGQQGSSLLLQAGRQTSMLSPSLNYVPWIVLDNSHDEYIQRMGEWNLITLLCQRHKEEFSRPKVCRTIQRSISKRLPSVAAAKPPQSQ